jgi:hypothetical protein
MTGNMLDNTAHMNSSKDQTSVKIRQAKRQGKEYALHPPWLVLPDQASEPTLAYARAAGHRGDTASGRWGRRRGAPTDTGAKIPFDLPIRFYAIVTQGEKNSVGPWAGSLTLA